ncbi:MAG: hypothetical protein SPL73_05670 [Cyanobacteriota bacterium]|nr:hypothetical protein [Cyanobacteriota bacterium]MDY6364360.1 hypothetical protein [Cyanobacteriota bacterium]
MPIVHFECCGKEIKTSELWILKDIKGFTARKLFIGKCSVCGDDAAFQVMKSIKNGKVYYNLYNGIEAVKIIYREKKRKLIEFANISSNALFGWVYGTNKTISKNGKTTVLQYATDFAGNKQLVKKIIKS